MSIDFEARFWTKVEKTDTCWLWHGTRVPDGYGQFWIGDKAFNAHRVAYELLVGPIPDGLTIDHLCRVRACVNPDHLEPVTNRENILRGVGPPAQNARKTHCPKGHPYDEANTRHYRHKGLWRRQCRACHKVVGRESARRKREKFYALGLTNSRKPYKREATA